MVIEIECSQIHDVYVKGNRCAKIYIKVELTPTQRRKLELLLEQKKEVICP